MIDRNKEERLVKASKYERKIVNEMIKKVRKYFNRESNFCTNQQVLGMREVFRGVVVKSWVYLPLEKIKFSKHNEKLVRKAVNLHSECRKEQNNALHSPEYKKINLNKEIK